MPAWPPKKLKWRHTSPYDHRLPPLVLRGCFAAKNFIGLDTLKTGVGLIERQIINFFKFLRRLLQFLEPSSSEALKFDMKSWQTKT